MHSADLGRRPRVLVELRDCLGGLVGIPQDTRLIYAMLAASGAVELGGLLGTTHDMALPRPPAESDPPLERCWATARQVLAFQGALERHRPGGWASVRRRLAKLPPARIMGAALARRLPPPAVPLDPLDEAAAGDFLWSALFAPSLDPGGRDRILQTRFALAGLGRRRALARLHAGLPPAILGTAGWDVLLASRPFPARPAAGTRLVVRYHDSLPLTHPHTLSAGGTDAFDHRAALLASIRAGATFACNSAPVEAELLRLVPALAGRTAVVPCAVAPAFFPDPQPAEALARIVRRRALDPTAAGPALTRGTPALARYALAVGTLEPRKGYATLLEAWGRLALETWGQSAPEAGSRPMPGEPAPPLLVLVANPGWRGAAEQAELARLMAEGSAVQLGQVPAGELRALYSGARVVACPSHAEGFGLGGLEAMACGTPVVASDIPAHRWVYGEAAEFVPPGDAEALLAALRPHLAQTVPAGSSRRALLLARAAGFSMAAIGPQWAALPRASTRAAWNLRRPRRRDHADGPLGPCRHEPAPRACRVCLAATRRRPSAPGRLRGTRPSSGSA